jgi:ketosteroid isomerase-like protein
MISLLLALALQSSDKLPPANPLPPPGAEEVAVLAPVNAVLAAIPTHDRVAVEAQLLPGGSATVAVEKPDGTRQVRRMAWADWLANFKPGPEQVRETQGMPAIEIDGDVAMVWASFTFTIDGKAHHCGTNHWDLVRDAGRWKIANITWSQRTTGCEVR